MKKGLILIGILGILLTSHIISKSYAVFETSVSGKEDLDVATWNITVNNTMLNNNANIFMIDTVTYTSDGTVKANTFAPGVTGTFDLVIDPGDTQVAFEYEFNFDLVTSSYPQIEFTSVTGKNGTNLTLQNGVYSKVFPLSDIEAGKTDTITIQFTWEKGAEETYDALDSYIGTHNTVLEIPFSITFRQYVG